MKRSSKILGLQSLLYLKVKSQTTREAILEMFETYLNTYNLGLSFAWFSHSHIYAAF